MRVNHRSLDALLADARRSVLQGAEKERDYARQTRQEAFDASIDAKLEAAEHQHASAVHEYEIENVKGMASLVPMGLADGPAWVATVGRERRHEYAAAVGLQQHLAGAEQAVELVEGLGQGDEHVFVRTLEGADRQKQLERDELAKQAEIVAERRGNEAADARDALGQARERMTEVLQDARAMEQERREAVRLANDV